MQQSELKKVFIDELKDIYSAETQLVRANKECGWKGGDRGGLAPWEQFGKRRNKEEQREKRKNA